MKLLYSIKDAALVLGTGNTLLYSRINDGQLEAVKLGSRTLITADSIKALISRATEGAA